MDTAREVTFPAMRRPHIQDEESEQAELLLNDAVKADPVDREATDATAGPLPPEGDDEEDEESYYAEVGSRSWQVIKRVFLVTGMLVVFLVLLAYKTHSWPRWHSRGQDVIKKQAFLSSEKVCGAIYCPEGGECCHGEASLCCDEHAQCCSNGKDAMCCGKDAMCCNGICCDEGAVCCNGICGAHDAECTHGIVLTGYSQAARLT
eukprot:TRINITY_DN49519_c0_g1_i1.p1 TRINITY_DN49519_c0_g1~~TRINITY_DN49519_c0_g1_i1.p1  ORF type:complete len:205 (-),score=42.16 TRINITY_DN49519_c0_g1_i1:88-702(-)